jgi:hypothetical protein
MVVRAWFARGAGVALGAAAWLAAGVVSAAGIDVRCARLSRREIDELDARARLALAAHPKPELLPLAIVCDSHRAWLETAAGPNPVPIDEREGIVEGALAALESLMQPPPAAPSPAPPTPLPPPASPPSSSLETSTPSSPPARASTGGIGLAATSEPWAEAGGASLGPRLDIALPVGGAFAAVASESVRFALAPGSGPATSLVDVQVGAAWGAPYASRRTVGFAMLVGMERFAASSSDDKLRSADVWTAAASLGARAAVRAGPFEWWLGLDAVLRATRPETPDPVHAVLPRVGAALTIGFFYPAESANRAPRGASTEIEQGGGEAGRNF